MKRLSALLAIGVLAVLAGCGGGDSLAPEVPGGPAAIVPHDAGDAPAEAAAAAQNRNDSASTSSDDTSTSSDSTSTDTGSTDTGSTDTGTTGDTSGGTAAPDTGDDTATNDTPPPADSNAQQFEDFCAQNQGAC
jgi:hypothetical protein